MSIDNTDDIIDSRDIIDRIAELKQSAEEGSADEYETSEFWSLVALAKDASVECSDWRHGETLIRRSYWVEYVQDMLADCGTIPKDIPWFVEIDWEATAKNIESDYASVDFDGVEYLIRSC